MVIVSSFCWMLWVCCRSGALKASGGVLQGMDLETAVQRWFFALTVQQLLLLNPEAQHTVSMLSEKLHPFQKNLKSF